MGLLSNTSAITRYRVNGELPNPITESVYHGLKNRMMTEIDDVESPQSVGWTTFQDPFVPSFEGSSFVYGSHFVFALRIDKKIVAPKLIQKYTALEGAKKCKATGKAFLTRNEKKIIKGHVTNLLYLRIPATPSIYQIVWNYDDSVLWFFTHQKKPNEELETLFKTSFDLLLTRIFPYTFAETSSAMSGLDLDMLASLSPTTLLR